MFILKYKFVCVCVCVVHYLLHALWLYTQVGEQACQEAAAVHSPQHLLAS